ncbi:MAG: gamma-glutamyl-gamma-aminobutyrate hydrolase family protein [Magnetococcales bacterium]|nr:gamma-glutamyl-gamma-aminobutyrate hydrolase family protein [Magnetococcales bacterium]
MTRNLQPKVALTMRITQATGYLEPRDSISHDWLIRLQSWNMQPILLPNLLDDPVAWLKANTPDLLILTGGDNIHEKCQRFNTETKLVEQAMSAKLPILGVCRGLQWLNTIQFGGKLAPIAGHAATTHAVDITPRFQQIYGNRITINSYHEFGIPPDGLGVGLETLAMDAAGWIEGVYLPGEPLAGIMWHPERVGGAEGDLQLLRSLIDMRRTP